MHPSVATMPPKKPPTFKPTNVAALIAIGPGVICEIVTRLENSCVVIQCSSLTINDWMSGRHA